MKTPRPFSSPGRAQIPVWGQEMAPFSWRDPEPKRPSRLCPVSVFWCGGPSTGVAPAAPPAVPGGAQPGGGRDRKRRTARPERKRRPRGRPDPLPHLEIVATEVHAAHERQHSGGLHGAALAAGSGGRRGRPGEPRAGRRRPRPFNPPPPGGREGEGRAAPLGTPRTGTRQEAPAAGALGLSGPQFPYLFTERKALEESRRPL